MADNVSITEGSGKTIATEDVSSVQHQKVKIEFGGDGVATMVSASDPLPVSATIDTTGLATTTTDTNTTTIAGDTTSIDAKIPALGQALAAASTPVVLTAAQITTLTPPAAITGFATSAKQDTIIGHVDGVETLLGTIDSKLGGTLTVTGGGGGTEYTEDAAAAANPVGTVLQLIREDARAGGLTTADGDNVAVRGNNKGEMYVKTTDSDVLLTTIDADTSTLAGAVSGTEMQVDVLTMPTTAVTNAGITTIAGAVAGTEMQVDVLTMPTTAVTQSGTWDEVGINDSGNSITVDNAQLSVVGTGTEATAMRVTIASDSTGVLSVDDNGGALTVDGTVTANLAAGTNNIGDVDILSIAAGDNNIGNVDIVSGTITTVSTVTSVTAIANALPAGTNAIGKLAANSGVDIGDVTLTAGTAAIGSILPPDTDVTAHTNYARKYYTNAGAVTDGIVWSPAAGKRWHVVTMYIQTSAAATITLEDDKAAGDDPVWKGEIAANSGVTLSFTEHYPMASGEDAADLLVTTSAGNIYITAVGYEI